MASHPLGEAAIARARKPAELLEGCPKAIELIEPPWIHRIKARDTLEDGLPIGVEAEGVANVLGRILERPHPTSPSGKS
jgi:hypothetical protein